MITLDQARILIAATRRKSRELELNPLTIVVLDPGGHLVAMEREDGSAFGRPDIAIGKAAGALAMGVSSRRLGDMAAERPQFMAALSASWNGRLIPAAGGVLLKDTAGNLLGAVGVSGDLSDKDEEAALAGLETAGMVAG